MKIKPTFKEKLLKELVKVNNDIENLKSDIFNLETELRQKEMKVIQLRADILDSNNYELQIKINKCIKEIKIFLNHLGYTGHRNDYVVGEIDTENMFRSYIKISDIAMTSNEILQAVNTIREVLERNFLKKITFESEDSSDYGTYSVVAKFENGVGIILTQD